MSLVPPAFLLGAGYLQREATGDVVTAVLHVVLGYAVLAAVTTIPGIWVFNEVVAEAVTDYLSTGVAEAVVQVRLLEPVRAHLLLGLGYPLVFGGIGAVLAEVVGEAGSAG